MSDRSVVQGSDLRRLQVKAERKDAFNREKKQAFLDHLAGCCNVMRAAAAIGVSQTTVNNHRRSDPAFAQAFAEALATGYAGLEAMLLDRAAGGGAADYTPGGSGEAVPGPESVDVPLAQFLLTLRQRELGVRAGVSARQPSRVSEKELNEAILAKLELLDASLRNSRRKRK